MDATFIGGYGAHPHPIPPQLPILNLLATPFCLTVVRCTLVSGYLCVRRDVVTCVV